MIYAIIILVLAVIYLYARITNIRNEQNRIILKGFEKFTNGYIEQKSKDIKDFIGMIRDHEITQIIGINQDDELVSLVRQAKEKGYFNKPFSPFNHSSDMAFTGHKVYIEKNIMGTCLFISSSVYFPLGVTPYRACVNDISCIYQNGKWANIIEDHDLLSDAEKHLIKMTDLISDSKQKEVYRSKNELQQLFLYRNSGILDQLEKLHGDDSAAMACINKLRKYIL